MAKYNIDGTLISLETAIETLDVRFGEEAHPHLSDLLGSDWIKADQDYKQAAYDCAARIYKSADE